MSTSIIITNEENKNSNNGFTLTQSSPYYNPYIISVKGKGGYVNNILFYDDNGVQAQTNRGWFGENNRIQSIIFNTKKPIVRKTKLDFTTKSPFIIKSGNNILKELRYDLYIYIPDLPKFEVSYSKMYRMIMKNVDIGLPEPRYNFISQSVKYLGEAQNAESELRNACKALDDYSIENMPEIEFNNKLLHLKDLFNNMKVMQEYVKNYSVEDYLKEIEAQ